VATREVVRGLLVATSSGCDRAAGEASQSRGTPGFAREATCMNPVYRPVCSSMNTSTRNDS
jgi:hypothetical protein